MKHGRLLLAGPLVAMVILATGAGFGESIHIGDGETQDGRLSSVNGTITIGDGATVSECHSVNGTISIGRDSRAESLNAVNGEIRVGEEVVIAEGISSVNGGISLARHAHAESISTVNGPIRLNGAEIGRNVKTINGNIELTDGARIGGDVIIEEPGRNSDQRRKPLRIELDGGSVIEGDVIVENSDTKVEIYLRGGSQIMGRVQNATVIEG